MAEIDFIVSLQYKGIQSKSRQPTKSLHLKKKKIGKYLIKSKESCTFNK